MRARKVVCLTVVAALAAGCAISPTGVLDGGEPAVGFQPSIRLYFVSGTRLRAVTRPLPWPSLKESLNLLVDGPTSAERRQGLRTELDGRAGRPRKVTSGAAKVRISLDAVPVAPVPVDAAPVPDSGPVDPAPVAKPVPAEVAPVRPRSLELWLGQLTCTAATALAARSNIDRDAVTVTIQRGKAESLGSFRCSEFPRAPE
jgi:hypothetical protein